MLLITKARMNHGLSMSALARKAEMHVSSVSQIESGHLTPYPKQKEKLAKALEWQGDVDDLFRDIEDISGEMEVPA